MARFLIGTVPVIGHINPIVPVAQALLDRGHDVCWYTGEHFRSKIEAVGARWLPMTRTIDFGRDGADAFPERAKYRGLDQIRWDLKHIFIDAAAGQAEDLRKILETYHADVVLADTMFVGARLLHEAGQGPVWAKFNISVLGGASADAPPMGLGLSPGQGTAARARNRMLHTLSDKVIFRDVHRHYGALRRRFSLPDDGRTFWADLMSPYLWLQSTVPAFEYPVSHRPPQVHFVGAVLPPSSPLFLPPVWWDEVVAHRRPAVLVTQGTVATDFDELIRPACRALADEEILVIVTTAGKKIGMPLATNVRVADFLPYDRLMPYIDALVTNGGYGTVHYALSHGLPIVAGGTTEDKPEVCERIAWSGVGVRLRGQPASEAQIRDGVRRVLTEPGFRRNAERIRKDLSAHAGPQEAADLLEELARTQRPVVDRLDPAGEYVSDRLLSPVQ